MKIGRIAAALGFRVALLLVSTCSHSFRQACVCFVVY